MKHRHTYMKITNNDFHSLTPADIRSNIWYGRIHSAKSFLYCSTYSLLLLLCTFSKWEYIVDASKNVISTFLFLRGHFSCYVFREFFYLRF